MTIADLFVNLGVKGDGPAQKALQNTKSKLGEVKSMGLETKAMILAVVYGLEKMMSASAKTGTGFSNFAANTGLSIQKLQQWQYAARQVGVASDEVEGSVRNVQSAITNMLMGKGAPEGFAMVANKVGLDPKRMRDTYYMMEQLQKFARAVPPDVAANMLKSFGLSENVIAAMQKNAFRPEIMKKAPTYSDSEVGKLNKVDAAWGNVGEKIKMALGHLTAQKGLGMVNEISKMVDQVIRLVGALTELADRLKIFQVMGKLFEGVADIAHVATGAVDLVFGNDKKKDKVKKEMGDFSKRDITPWDDSIKSFFGGGNKTADASQANAKMIAPTMKPNANAKTQNINVKQDLHFQHDGKDHAKTSKSVHKAVQESYRQYSAQAQGT